MYVYTKKGSPGLHKLTTRIVVCMSLHFYDGLVLWCTFITFVKQPLDAEGYHSWWLLVVFLLGIQEATSYSMYFWPWNIWITESNRVGNKEFAQRRHSPYRSKAEEKTRRQSGV